MGSQATFYAVCWYRRSFCRIRACQRYESGDLLPTRAMRNTLVLLDGHPAAVSVLIARHAALLAKQDAV